jgi:hypothetical protein
MTNEHTQGHKPEKGLDEHKAAEKSVVGTPITDKADNNRQDVIKQADALRSFKLTRDGQNSFTLVDDSKEIKDTRPLRRADAETPLIALVHELGDLPSSAQNHEGKRIADRDDVLAWKPDVRIEQLSERNAPAKHSAGDFERIKDKEGELKIPSGDPDFGYPDSFNAKAYSARVNNYVKWIETYDGKAIGWDHMSSQDKVNFANSVRHALGIAYLIYKGVDPEIAIKLALGHEGGDTSLDSKQDRRNNIWAAHLADQFAGAGKNWNQLVAEIVRAAQHTSHSGFLDQYQKRA